MASLSLAISSAPKAELLQHFVGLLAELRRPRHHPARRARQRHGLADQADVAVFIVRHLLRDAEMLDLRVFEHLVDGVDRPAGHAGLVELTDPGLGGLRQGTLLDLGIECVAVLGAGWRGHIVGVAVEFRRADRLRAALPDPATRRGDVDVAVRGPEHAGRDAGRVIVAGLFCHVLFHQPARGLEVEHEDLGLQQRSLYPLALARDLALQQRGEDAHGAEQARGEVGDGNADPHRAFARRTGDRHQSAHALRDLIEARPLVVGPVLAEAGDAAIDDARVDLAQALIVDAELLLHVGTEIFHHDVGLGGEALEHGKPALVLQVQRHRPLVAMQILEIGAPPRPARLFAAGILGQRVDLDHAGAPVRELPHAGGPGPDAGQIEYGEARQGFGGMRKGHLERLPGQIAGLP
ncbi:hypothetical protein ACVWWG_008999 [Bradyrhizobium sp. LB7.2]